MATDLDSGQVIKRSFDEDTEALKVNVVQMSGGDASGVNIIISIVRVGN